MPIWVNFRQFWGFRLLKLWRHWSDPKRDAVPPETRVLRYCSLKSIRDAFCSFVQKSVTLKKEEKLLTECRKVIFHPYEKKPPLIWLLPNVGFPSQTWSIVPNFIFIVLIVFGWQDPKYWVFPLTWEVTFTTARALPIQHGVERVCWMPATWLRLTVLCKYEVFVLLQLLYIDKHAA